MLQAGSKGFQLQGDPLQVPPCWSYFNVIPTHFTDMNSEVKTKWLEALRGGEYKQTRYTLHSPNDGFCCLGVLCDIYTKEFGGSCEYDEREYTCGYTLEVGDELAQVELPHCVVEWAGLEMCSPEVHVAVGDSDFVPTTLAELNDEGKGFEYIADVIDHQL